MNHRLRKRRRNPGIKQQLGYGAYMMGEPTACHWCGESKSYSHLTVDHIVSLGLGGRDSPSNAVLACCRCNIVRSQHDEYRAGRMKRVPPQLRVAA